jgi:hypothetical protein
VQPVVHLSLDAIELVALDLPELIEPPSMPGVFELVYAPGVLVARRLAILHALPQIIDGRDQFGASVWAAAKMRLGGLRRRRGQGRRISHVVHLVLERGKAVDDAVEHLGRGEGRGVERDGCAAAGGWFHCAHRRDGRADLLATVLEGLALAGVE